MADKIYRLNGIEIDIHAERQIGDTTYPRGALLQLRDKWITLGITEEAAPIPQPPTAAELLAQARQHFIDMVAEQLNAAAAARRYTSIDTACAYAGAPNRFQAESQAFVTYRGSVWDMCYAIEAEVLAGARAVPTDAEFLALLPPAP